MACFISPESLMQSLKIFQIRETINYHLGIRESYYAMCDWEREGLFNRCG